MSNRHDIYADGGRHERERASRQVNIPLLIAAGLVGLPLLMGISQRVFDDEAEAPQVTPDQNYPNNSFLPGAGYYHEPYHAWFPMPYNEHDVARGWYRGGRWRASPDRDSDEAPDVGSGYSSGSSGFAGSSRPTPAAAARANHAASDYHASSIRRGGFGGSSHSIFS